MPEHVLRQIEQRHNLARASMILGAALMELFGDPEVEFAADGGFKITDRSSRFEAGSRLSMRVMDEHGQWHPPDHEWYGVSEDELAIVREAVHDNAEE